MGKSISIHALLALNLPADKSLRDQSWLDGDAERDRAVDHMPLTL